jgi:hypothetical protein
MARRRRLHPEDIRDLPDRSREARKHALEVLSMMRQGDVSLTAAAELVGTTRKTVLKYAGRALEKSPSGEWEAKPWDRIIRLVRFPTLTGSTVLPIKDSRSASKIARYWGAVDQFLREGVTEGLRAFKSEVVQVDGIEYRFVTDPLTIERVGRAGEVQFEYMYADAA